MKTILILTACFALSGCATAAKRMAQFDELGITEAEVTGKWSHTAYSSTTEGGVTVSVIEHSNAWFPRVMLKRERPAVQQ